MKQFLMYLLAFIPSLCNALTCWYRRVKVGKQVKFNGRIRVYGRGLIQIGDRVRINSGQRYNPIGGDTTVILNSSANGRIVIGEDSGLSNCTIVSRESVTIGKNVRIGGSTHIYDTDFHAISFEDRILQGDENTQNKPVRIEDGVFIGSSVIILKGVTVGAHSVIGAGAVVTKDIPAGEIWAGNPARFVKKIKSIQ